MTGEKCPLVEYCQSFDKGEVTVYDCNYKSSDELCFKGLVFDVGDEAMDRLRRVREELLTIDERNIPSS